MNKFTKARAEEIQYHERFYEETELFAPGTWLSKPVKVVLDSMDMLDSNDVRVLDLGCGVGRNSIPIAQRIQQYQGKVIGVDLIPSAIRKLNENAKAYGVGELVEGVVADAEQYVIAPNAFDYIVACSCLEHVSSVDALHQVVRRMIEGTRAGGVNCLLMNTEITEADLLTGESAEGVIELNLRTLEAYHMLRQLYRDWDIRLERQMPQAIREYKGGRDIEFRSNWLTFVAQKKVDSI